MSADPIEYRERALHCAEMAQDAVSPELKQTLFELSHTWWKLANRVERTDDPAQPLKP